MFVVNNQTLTTCVKDILANRVDVVEKNQQLGENTRIKRSCLLEINTEINDHSLEK